MTYDEKMAVAEQFEFVMRVPEPLPRRLQRTRDEALVIISSSVPSTEGEELEVDFDVLSNDAMWDLHRILIEKVSHKKMTAGEQLARAEINLRKLEAKLERSASSSSDSSDED